MSLPFDQVQKLLADGYRPDGTQPCACGAAKADHSGSKNSGGVALTGCRKYRRDMVDLLAEEALADDEAHVLDAVRDWHARVNPRPKVGAGQFSVGPSDLNNCRREIWYRETPPEGFEPDEEGTDWAAIMGSIIHDNIARARASKYGKSLLHEQAVRISGLDRPGRLDEYDRRWARITDFKSKGTYPWDALIEFGPDEADWEQAAVYAFGWVEAGHPVKQLRLLYINRATGEERRFIRPYTDEAGRAARGKLLALLAELEMGVEQPRDRSGPSSDWKCRNCFARSHCWNIPAAEAAGRSPESYTILGPDPDWKAKEWAAGLITSYKQDAKAAKAELTAAKPLLEGILTPGETRANFGAYDVVEKSRRMPDHKKWAEKVAAARERHLATPEHLRGDFADVIATIPVPKRLDVWIDVEFAKTA